MREAVMSGIEAVLAIAFLAVLLAGVAIGVIIVVGVASNREDRRGTLTSEAPDAITRGARKLTGAGTRTIVHAPPGDVSPTPREHVR
jgi:hypothetical protein